MLHKLWCFVFGHRYEVLQHFGRNSRRVICHRCGGDWGMCDSVQSFVPWDGDLAEHYEWRGFKLRERTASRR